MWRVLFHHTVGIPKPINKIRCSILFSHTIPLFDEIELDITKMGNVFSSTPGDRSRHSHNNNMDNTTNSFDGDGPPQFPPASNTTNPAQPVFRDHGHFVLPPGFHFPAISNSGSQDSNETLFRVIRMSDGTFSYQHLGPQVSPEEAGRMMIVPPTTTAAVATTERTSNLTGVASPSRKRPASSSPKKDEDDDDDGSKDDNTTSAATNELAREANRRLGGIGKSIYDARAGKLQAGLSTGTPAYVSSQTIYGCVVTVVTSRKEKNGSAPTDRARSSKFMFHFIWTDNRVQMVHFLAYLTICHGVGCAVTESLLSATWKSYVETVFDEMGYKKVSAKLPSFQPDSNAIPPTGGSSIPNVPGSAVALCGTKPDDFCKNY